MNHLALLGRLSLVRSNPSPDGQANRPRILALLAIAAVAGKVGVPRDKVLVYLWPESDTRRARNSLHQNLRSIRLDLGDEAIFSGQEIALNPDSFSVDLWDFEAALEAGDPDRAIELYAGPFLSGLGLSELPEFEEWMEGERARIERRYASALEDAARLAAGRGNHPRAIELLRTRTALDPLSGPPALALMQALVAAGDRASAISFGQEYTELVRRELSSDPDPSIQNFLRELRVRAPERDAPRLRTPAKLPPISVDIPGTVPTVPTIEVEWTGPAAIPSAATYGPPRWVRFARMTTAVFATAITVFAATSNVMRPGPPVPSTEVIAVFPFTVAGSAESQYLGHGLVDLLSTSLDGAGMIRGVDPRALLAWLESNRITSPAPAQAGPIAARFGAARYILGSVTSGGSRVRLLASLYQRGSPDSVIASAISEGDAGDLFRIVDDLTSQLLVAALPGPRHRLVRVAASTTGSLAALKHYLTGEEELRDGRYFEAAEAFQQAVRLDTSFALAYFRLGIAADWIGRDSMAQAATAAAMMRADRLSERDARLVRAIVSTRRGDAQAERMFREFVADYPDDLEAWQQLGEMQFHGNPLRGRSATESRYAYERVLALDSDNDEALLHLARIAALEGKRSEVDSLTRRLLHDGPRSEVLELRAFRAFALSDHDSWKLVTRELVERPPDVPPATAVEVALFLDDVDGAEKFAKLLTTPRYSGQVRGLGHRLLARAAATRGQWDVARIELDTAQRFDATAALELRSLLAAFDFLDVPLAQVREIRAGLERWDAESADRVGRQHSAGHTGLHSGIKAYRLGLLSARSGDAREVLAQADLLDREAAQAQGRRARALATFAHSLRARVAMIENKPAEALHQLDLADWAPIESSFEEEALDRYLRANLLEALGRDAEALAWYRTIAERATHEVMYVAPSRLRQSLIAGALNDQEESLAAYQVAAKLWATASPSLRDTIAATSRSLRQLGVQVPDTGHLIGR